MFVQYSYCAEKVIDPDIFFLESSPKVDDKVKLVHFSSPSERGVGQKNGEGGRTSWTPLENGKTKPIAVCEEGPGICAIMLTICSVLMIMATLPVSLLFTVKVVQVDDSKKVCDNIHFTIQGVWESGHLPAWSPSYRRCTRSGSVLHHSLCGYLWKDWHENCYLWDTSPGGKAGPNMSTTTISC